MAFAIPPITRKYNGIMTIIYEFGPNEPYEWVNPGVHLTLASYMYTSDHPIASDVDIEAGAGGPEDYWPVGGGFFPSRDPSYGKGSFSGIMPATGAKWLCIVQADIKRRKCEYVEFNSALILPARVGLVVVEGLATVGVVAYGPGEYIEPYPQASQTVITTLDCKAILVKPDVRGI